MFRVDMLIAALLTALSLASADNRSSRQKRFLDFSNFNFEDAVSTIEDGLADLVGGTDSGHETDPTSPENDLLVGLGNALEDIAQAAEEMIETGFSGDETASAAEEPNVLEQTAGDLWTAISGEGGGGQETREGTAEQTAPGPGQEEGDFLESLVEMASTLGQTVEEEIEKLGEIDLHALAKSVDDALQEGGIDIAAIDKDIHETIGSFAEEMAADVIEMKIGDANVKQLAMISAIFGEKILKDGEVETGEIDEMLAVLENVIEGGDAISNQPAMRVPAPVKRDPSAPSGRAVTGRLPGDFVLVLAAFAQMIFARIH